MAFDWMSERQRNLVLSPHAGGTYPQGIPQPPQYTPSFDPLTMPSPEYDKRGLDRIRAEALRKGFSPWAAMAKSKQGIEELDARERAKREGRYQAAQARTDLAMRGGLSSGASERIAQRGMQDTMSSIQQVGRQGNLARLGIDVQDETNRLNTLSQLPQVELQKFGADERNLQRVIDENKQRQGYNLDVYKEAANALAAEKQAQAVERSGKK